MRELLEWTFTESKGLKVVNGVPQVVTDTKPVKCWFSLLHGGHKLFEQIYGQSISSVFMSANIVDEKEIERVQKTIKNKEAQERAIKEIQARADKTEMAKLLTNAEFIGALCCASYLKIVDNDIVCNVTTAQEFANSNLINTAIADTAFTNKLLDMVFSTISKQEKKEQTNKQQKSKNNNSRKKF